MVFSVAAMVALVVIWPQYAKRQRRLEMQYQAQQEIARRQVAGEPKARGAGQEGDAPPPAAGELIIPLWPLLLVAAAVTCLSAAMVYRTTRRVEAPGSETPSEQGRRGPP
jgi:membrane protein implicated in regulation of membrane protease activity